MKRLIAGLMVILMLGQYFPGVSFAASVEEQPAKETQVEALPEEENFTQSSPVDEWHEVISAPVEKRVYHTVSFTVDGEELTRIFVADGAEISTLPEAPEIVGEEFLGWYDGDQLFTGETAIYDNKSIFGVYGEKEDVEGAIYASEDFYITGKVPGNGIIDVVPVQFEVDGEETIAAYDISIYASKKQQEKGKTWQPAEKKVQVHWRNDAFEGELNVYHLDAEQQPQYVDTVEAENGWVEFEARSFSVYAVTQTILNKTVTTSDGATYEIRVTYQNTTGIPMKGTELAVSEILPDDAAYMAYLEESARKVGTKTENIEFARAFDISIVDEKDQTLVYEPTGDVNVAIRLIGNSLDEYANVDVLHFAKPKNLLMKSSASRRLSVEEMDSSVSGDTVQFTTDSFSVYVVAGYVIEKEITASDGQTYRITVEYDDRAGIPGDARLKVEEVSEDKYAAYLAEAAGLVGADIHSISFGELFDISIVKDGVEYQPNDAVRVTVELLNVDRVDDVQVVHFGDESTPEQLAASTDGRTVAFETDSFSIFSFLDFSLLDRVVSAVLGEKNGTLYENDDIILTGRMPSAGIVEAKRVNVSVDGREALVAYDIKIYAGPLMKLLGINWQPSGDAIHVTLKSDALNVQNVDVYHMENATGEADLVTENLHVKDNSVSFDANQFSVYVIAETVLVKTVKASDGNTYEISVTYSRASGIPMKGTELEVSEILPGDEDFDGYMDASVSKLGIRPESIGISRVFDIRIVDEKDHSLIYEPVSEVEVSITLVGSDLDKFANVDLLHFVEDAGAGGYTVYDMAGVTDGETIQFTTDSFSVYVVVGTTYLRTYRFYSFNEFGEYEEYPLYMDSGKTVYTQIIKNGEKPVAPQNPVNPQDPNATFAGWYEDIREAGVEDPVLAAVAYDFDNIPEITRNEEVRLYAKFNSYAYVVFYDQYDTETGTFPVARTVREVLTGNPAEADINISSYRVTYHGSNNDMVFTGWSEVPITVPGSPKNDLDEAVVKLDDTITVTGNKELYPIFTPVFWLSYYSGPTGSGATYYPDTYYYNGVGPENLADHIPSRRAGSSGAYTFAGWYAGAVPDADTGEIDPSGAVMIADEHGSLVPNASAAGISVDADGQSLTLTASTTLYAVWTTSGTASCTVAIWRQKATDAPGLSDSEKTYEFAESFVLSGTIGDHVNAGESDYISLTKADVYNRLHSGADVSGETNPYYGYSYNGVNSDTEVTILADGSAVLDIRYDWVGSDQPDMTDRSFTLTLNTSGGIASDDLPKVIQEVDYSADLDSYDFEPAADNPQYSFTGWYTDEGCMLRVFFHEPTVEEKKPLQILTENPDTHEEEWDGHSYREFVVLSGMPGTDLTLYAGWEEARYLVIIDPNYGAMYGPENGSGTGATWFRTSYGEKIQEYTTVTRDYVESASGTWYYVNHDLSGNYTDRHTYYTQDPSKATEFTSFVYEPGIYRYDGWYEVLTDGSESLYDFSKIVKHDITLKLHWTRVGAFYLVYDPGIGTLKDNEDQEIFYTELDENHTYADNADVVVTRIAAPPDGYEFAGWKIRGDESETVYYPGRSFTLLTRYAATVQGRKTVYLDAVYTKVPTASIVYSANGGTITENELDYGGPVDPTAPDPSYSCDPDAGTAIIANLVNNSRVYLSDGSGFSRIDATFIGWSNKSVYDPDDEEAIFYLPGEQLEETYNVDTAEPLKPLYAVWQVSVKYHLNQPTSTADFGGTWGDGYTLNPAGDTYTQNVCIGTIVRKPDAEPRYTGSEGLTFRYWAVMDDSDNFSMYDFSEQVPGPLDLYAFWDDPLSVNIHAVDASNETLISMDSSWLTKETMAVEANAVTFDETTASEYVDVPAGYEFAFAAVHSGTVDLQEVAESAAADSVSYNSADGKIHVRYADGSDSALAAGEEIYLIYYQKKTLGIEYMTMADNGALTAADVDSVAPSGTVSALGQYDMAAGVTAPLEWLINPDYLCYAFAVGSASADRTEDLTLITSTSDMDASRPALLVKNTWRGFRYSVDGGGSWIDCGYEPTLYTIYFASEVTVVTFTENTVGLAADMHKAFTFNYRIESVSKQDGAVTGTVYDTETTGNNPVQLSNGEAYSVVLFTDENTTQQLTITQSSESGFTTSVRCGGEEVENPFIYKPVGTGTVQSVVFTNTHDPAVTVEIHVALVDEENGSIKVQDELRSTEYSFDLGLGAQKTFETVLPAEDVFTGDSDTYAFGAVLYGTDDGSAVAVDGMNAISIACVPVMDGDDSLYGIYLLDGDGNRLTELGSYILYYLYYPMPVVRYVEEKDGGVLSPVQGSVDETSITYDGAALTLNGKTVEQNQKLEIPRDGLVISQSVGSGYFNMPPLLDRGTEKLYLIYSRIGVGAPDQTNISDISVSDELSLYLQIRDNRLMWSFDGSSWTAFTGMPVIYAVYHERGYTLEITKTVPPNDTGFTDPFTVTVSSTAISRTSYAVEGTGSSTVSAVKADGATPGSISVQVTDGSVIRIFGLGNGSYTVTESGNENHDLTVVEKYIDDNNGSPVTESLTVTDNSAVTITLDREKILALTNTPKVICKVGTRFFHTIQSAVQWIEDNSATFSGMIEMLVDYMMPASDSPVIPYYLDVTLKTASEYGDGTAVITRSGNFASGPMFTNSGKLTFTNVALDGNGSTVTASAAMIENEGTLAVGSGAELRNAKSSGIGGAIYSWNGAVNVSGGTVRGNTAVKGGAVYAEDGTVTVSSGSVTGNSAENGGAVYYAGNAAVSVSGGEVTGNSAENGGAVYLEKGTMKVSGGSMASNTASEDGGAVYAQNGAIEISGGTIGGSGTGNSAKNGGAVCLQNGSVKITKGTISGNTASENGGGIWSDLGTVSISGGSMASNTASENGGAVYAQNGAVVVSGGTIGGSGTGNTAVNGAAVYTNTGSATFSGGTVTGNTASEGGAVGVGSSTARLYFSGKATVTGNTMSGNDSNVYLDQDSDAVINATGLNGSASIGIYVPDMDVEVTDISGGTGTENLFDRRGVPGGFFGSYTSNSNVGRFSNDRLFGLSVQQEASSKRLYWGKAFTVEVRYLESFGSCFPTMADGTVKNIDNKTSITYYAPSGINAASAIADDLRNNHTIAGLSSSAVFGSAFVDSGRNFADYITDVNWDSSNNRWSFIRRDGSIITGTKLVVYYTEPSYISIENNTQYPLTVSDMQVLDQPVFNSDTVAGYGYVFAVNGAIQDNLRPVTAEDLILAPGKNVKILLPGGKNAAWMLNGGFTDASVDIPYTLNGTANTLLSDNTDAFMLNGTTLNTNGGTYEIVFGTRKAICKIVTTEISGVQSSEIAGQTTPDVENKVEYLFSTLNEAVTFAQTHSLTSATVELLVDYLIPGTDVANVPAGYSLTFTTATSGTYRYSEDEDARATISRDQGNNSSFIMALNGTLVDGYYSTSLKVENLIFDGKNIGGDSISGGIVKTKGYNVEINNVDFRNCVAKFGGGIYIESVDKNSPNKTPYGSLVVTGCNFSGCQSLHGEDKFGGGAVWTSMKEVTISNCRFISCKSKQQGGALFHYVAADGDRESSTTVDGCTFDGCYAGQAAGSMESGAKTVIVSSTVFRNSKTDAKNGGALNVWSGNSDTTKPIGKPTTYCKVILDNCTFEHCYANNGTGNNGNGGAMRSTATYNTITNCTFIDVKGNDGGAINIYNENAVTTKISDCTFRECDARNRGGAVYCVSKELIINGKSNSILNCTAAKEGGGIYHGKDGDGTKLTIDNTTVNHCESSTSGGGIYTIATDVILTGATVSDNTATGNGGGICHNTSNGRMTVDSCGISGNTSGGKGGGTYTLAQMTIRNNTCITGNRLSTENVADAAGVYLPNGKTLTVGTLGAEEADASTVTGNKTNKGGNPSNLRLSQKGNATSDNSENSIDVLCHLSGEIRVIDAFSKGKQFGVSEISTAESPVYTGGFSDIKHVFIADDDSLYGIIDRSDTSLRKIIWAGDPICKITDASGRLLYLDTKHEYPAVFDKLDVGKVDNIQPVDNTSAASPFSLLRSENPPLFYADGTPYNGDTYQVKMLVENYTATNYITSKAHEGRTIILATAGSADSQYPYRGRSGTRSTVIRGTAMGNSNFITARVNLTLMNIVLDGGSENGVTAGSIIKSEQSGVTVTLGRNSALQNSSVKGDGAGVYLNSASLLIEGGAIRNCTATGNGGGVYKTGGSGTVVMTGGSITRCTATKNGGGVYISNGPASGSFLMTGGSITRCEADKGGGVWLVKNCVLSMSGGSISSNKAVTLGGGIAVGGNGARLNFSGSAFVYGNTCPASLAATKASNVQMDQGFSVSANNPDTIIHTSGLMRGATIGVYVPAGQFEAHGEEADPFATYEGTPAGFNYFINDRNGLKGGLNEGQVIGTDMKIYWREIYTLEVNLEVLSKAATDKEKDFHFTVTLSETASGMQWNEVNDTYGDLDFHSGVAEFTLNGSTNSSTMADLLPLGFGYTVAMNAADADGFTVYPALTQSGIMNKASQFLYTVNFRVVRDVICKITDENYGLLYYKRGEAYTEAVYDALVNAFNRVNMGELYYKVGDSYIPYAANNHRIEMLVPEYEMQEAVALSAGKTVLLTTADPYADDGFPYAGGSSSAVIKRGYIGASMITVNGDLSLGNITLDGNSGSQRRATVDGGIINVPSGGSLTVGTGAALQNSVTTRNGAAVYLAEGGKMYISGAPEFSDNTTTLNLGSGAMNGGESYSKARQDIYIAGYKNTDASSLVVTGNLTGEAGSIWVWASDLLHYKHSMQFAVMQGGSYTGLNVFRNARTDKDTDNPCGGNPKYLYGVSRGSNVHWNGTMNLSISKTITGDMADITLEFPFTVTGVPAGQSCSYVLYTSQDGITWQESGTSGELTADASGMISGENLQLGNYQKIVISVPYGSVITVSEENGMYMASYMLDNGQVQNESRTAEITMNIDHTVAFVNNLPAVAPTGIRTSIMPFILMMAFGLILIVGINLRKRKKKEELR